MGMETEFALGAAGAGEQQLGRCGRVMHVKINLLCHCANCIRISVVYN